MIRDTYLLPGSRAADIQIRVCRKLLACGGAADGCACELAAKGMRVRGLGVIMACYGMCNPLPDTMPGLKTTQELSPQIWHVPADKCKQFRIGGAGEALPVTFQPVLHTLGI